MPGEQPPRPIADTKKAPVQPGRAEMSSIVIPGPQSQAKESSQPFVPDISAADPQKGGSTKPDVQERVQALLSSTSETASGAEPGDVVSHLTAGGEDSHGTLKNFVDEKHPFDQDTSSEPEARKGFRGRFDAWRDRRRGKESGQDAQEGTATPTIDISGGNSEESQLQVSETPAPKDIETPDQRGVSETQHPTIEASAKDDIVFGLAKRGEFVKEVAGLGRSAVTGHKEEQRAAIKKANQEARAQRKAERAERLKDKNWSRTRAAAEVTAGIVKKTPEALKSAPERSRQIIEKVVESVRYTSAQERIAMEEGLRQLGAGGVQTIPDSLRSSVEAYVKSNQENAALMERLRSGANAVKDRVLDSPSALRESVHKGISHVRENGVFDSAKTSYHETAKALHKAASLTIREQARQEASALAEMKTAYESGDAAVIQVTKDKFGEAFGAYQAYRDGELLVGDALAKKAVESAAGDAMLEGVIEVALTDEESQAVKDALLVKWTTETVSERISRRDADLAVADTRKAHSKAELRRIRYATEFEDFLATDMGKQIAAKLGVEDAYRLGSTFADVVDAGADIIANKVVAIGADGSAIVDEVADWYEGRIVRGRVAGKSQEEAFGIKEFATEELTAMLSQYHEAAGANDPEWEQAFIDAAERSRGMGALGKDVAKRATVMGLRKAAVRVGIGALAATGIVGTGGAALIMAGGAGAVYGGLRGGFIGRRSATESLQRAAVEKSRSQGGSGPTYGAGEQARNIGDIEDKAKQEKAAKSMVRRRTVTGAAIGGTVGAVMGAGMGAAVAEGSHLLFGKQVRGGAEQANSPRMRNVDYTTELPTKPGPNVTPVNPDTWNIHATHGAEISGEPKGTEISNNFRTRLVKEGGSVKIRLEQNALDEAGKKNAVFEFEVNGHDPIVLAPTGKAPDGSPVFDFDPKGTEPVKLADGSTMQPQEVNELVFGKNGSKELADLSGEKGLTFHQVEGQTYQETGDLTTQESKLFARVDHVWSGERTVAKDGTVTIHQVGALPGGGELTKAFDASSGAKVGDIQIPGAKIEGGALVNAENHTSVLIPKEQWGHYEAALQQMHFEDSNGKKMEVYVTPTLDGKSIDVVTTQGQPVIQQATIDPSNPAKLTWASINAKEDIDSANHTVTFKEIKPQPVQLKDIPSVTLPTTDQGGSFTPTNPPSHEFVFDGYKINSNGELAQATPNATDIIIPQKQLQLDINALNSIKIPKGSHYQLNSMTKQWALVDENGVTLADLKASEDGVTITNAIPGGTITVENNIPTFTGNVEGGHLDLSGKNAPEVVPVQPDIKPGEPLNFGDGKTVSLPDHVQVAKDGSLVDITDPKHVKILMSKANVDQYRTLLSQLKIAGEDKGQPVTNIGLVYNEDAKTWDVYDTSAHPTTPVDITTDTKLVDSLQSDGSTLTAKNAWGDMTFDKGKGELTYTAGSNLHPIDIKIQPEGVTAATWDTATPKISEFSDFQGPDALNMNTHMVDGNLRIEQLPVPEKDTVPVDHVAFGVKGHGTMLVELSNGHDGSKHLDLNPESHDPTKTITYIGSDGNTHTMPLGDFSRLVMDKSKFDALKDFKGHLPEFGKLGEHEVFTTNEISTAKVTIVDGKIQVERVATTHGSGELSHELPKQPKVDNQTQPGNEQGGSTTAAEQIWKENSTEIDHTKYYTGSHEQDMGTQVIKKGDHNILRFEQRGGAVEAGKPITHYAFQIKDKGQVETILVEATKGKLEIDPNSTDTVNLVGGKTMTQSELFNLIADKKTFDGLDASHDDLTVGQEHNLIHADTVSSAIVTQKDGKTTVEYVASVIGDGHMAKEIPGGGVESGGTAANTADITEIAVTNPTTSQSTMISFGSDATLQNGSLIDAKDTSITIPQAQLQQYESLFSQIQVKDGHDTAVTGAHFVYDGHGGFDLVTPDGVMADGLKLQSDGKTLAWDAGHVTFDSKNLTFKYDSSAVKISAQIPSVTNPPEIHAPGATHYEVHGRNFDFSGMKMDDKGQITLPSTDVIDKAALDREIAVFSQMPISDADGHPLAVHFELQPDGTWVMVDKKGITLVSDLYIDPDGKTIHFANLNGKFSDKVPSFTEGKLNEGHADISVPKIQEQIIEIGPKKVIVPTATGQIAFTGVTLNPDLTLVDTAGKPVYTSDQVSAILTTLPGELPSNVKDLEFNYNADGTWNVGQGGKTDLIIRVGPDGKIYEVPSGKLVDKLELQGGKIVLPVQPGQSPAPSPSGTTPGTASPQPSSPAPSPSGTTPGTASPQPSSPAPSPSGTTPRTASPQPSSPAPRTTGLSTASEVAGDLLRGGVAGGAIGSVMGAIAPARNRKDRLFNTIGFGTAGALTGFVGGGVGVGFGAGGAVAEALWGGGASVATLGTVISGTEIRSRRRRRRFAREQAARAQQNESVLRDIGSSQTEINQEINWIYNRYRIIMTGTSSLVDRELALGLHRAIETTPIDQNPPGNDTLILQRVITRTPNIAPYAQNVLQPVWSALNEQLNREIVVRNGLERLRLSEDSAQRLIDLMQSGDPKYGNLAVSILDFENIDQGRKDTTLRSILWYLNHPEPLQPPAGGPPPRPSGPPPGGAPGNNTSGL